jgi:hypothetical protein
MKMKDLKQEMKLFSRDKKYFLNGEMKIFSR